MAQLKFHGLNEKKKKNAVDISNSHISILKTYLSAVKIKKKKTHI